VRCYQPSRSRERIEREHAVTRWAGERGIPVAPPIADGSGRTVVGIGGELWAVFPWVEGRSLLRGTMTAREASLLGAMNGRLHRVLADWPVGDLQRNSELSWDTEKSIADLSRVDDLIRYYPARRRSSCGAGWIRDQLALLEGGGRGGRGVPEPPYSRATAPHERTGMVDATGEPVAVVGLGAVLPEPGIEVLRTLTFARLLEDRDHRLPGGYRGETRSRREQSRLRRVLVAVATPHYVGIPDRFITGTGCGAVLRGRAPACGVADEKYRAGRGTASSRGR